MPQLDEYDQEHDPAEVGVLNRRDDDDGDMPNLIVPHRPKQMIDLSKPEDSPDLPEGEWSKRHLLQFLARQPRDIVYIPKENWEPKGEDTFQVVGLQGHWFHIRKGNTESVPIQIAEIIKNSQMEFPTAQSQLMKRQITDIRDLPQTPDSRGVPGTEVFLGR